MNQEVHLLHLPHRNQLQPITAQHPAPPIKNVHNFFHLPNINGYFSIIYNETSAARCHNLVVLCWSAIGKCSALLCQLHVDDSWFESAVELLFCVCCHCCWPIATTHQCPHFGSGPSDHHLLLCVVPSLPSGAICCCPITWNWHWLPEIGQHQCQETHSNLGLWSLHVAYCYLLLLLQQTGSPFQH